MCSQKIDTREDPDPDLDLEDGQDGERSVKNHTKFGVVLFEINTRLNDSQTHNDCLH